MKARPILFNGEMVRAILNGRKTQTRRMVKFPINADPRYVTLTRMQDGFADGVRPVFGAPDEPNWFSAKSQFGTIGDRLWVRETWMQDHSSEQQHALHKASWGNTPEGQRWTPSIHMPRWASRITLEITGVRVERVQEITEEDAKVEGVESVMFQNEQFWKAYGSNPIPGGGELTATRLAAQSFRTLWQSIYANWDANPWVWVHEFRRIKP